jgi:hypothetical protein
MHARHSSFACLLDGAEALLGILEPAVGIALPRVGEELFLLVEQLKRPARFGITQRLFNERDRLALPAS